MTGVSNLRAAPPHPGRLPRTRGRSREAAGGHLALGLRLAPARRPGRPLARGHWGEARSISSQSRGPVSQGGTDFGLLGRRGRGQAIQAEGLAHPAPLAALGVRTGAVGLTGAALRDGTDFRKRCHSLPPSFCAVPGPECERLQFAVRAIQISGSANPFSGSSNGSRASMISLRRRA